jgi:ankyrin repeat protein
MQLLARTWVLAWLVACGCGGADREVESSKRESKKLAKRITASIEEPAEAKPDPEQERLDGLLVMALEDGNWTDVLMLIEEGADERVIVGHEGFTTLHLAALQADSDWVSNLLEMGADVNVTAPGGRTPLHLASWSGDVESLTRLLEAGADPGIVDGDGWGVLHWAALGGHPETVEFLVVARKIKLPKPSPGVTPVLVAAVRSGNLEVVKLLASKGAKVAAADTEGMTPLHHALAGGLLEIASFLLKKGAKANIRDSRARTALHLLAENCPENQACVDLAKQLVKKGAKKKDVDAEGKTAYDYALDGYDEALIAFLAPKGK